MTRELSKAKGERGFLDAEIIPSVQAKNPHFVHRKLLSWMIIVALLGSKGLLLLLVIQALGRVCRVAKHLSRHVKYPSLFLEALVARGVLYNLAHAVKLQALDAAWEPQQRLWAERRFLDALAFILADAVLPPICSDTVVELLKGEGAASQCRKLV